MAVKKNMKKKTTQKVAAKTAVKKAPAKKVPVKKAPLKKVVGKKPVQRIVAVKKLVKKSIPPAPKPVVPLSSTPVSSKLTPKEVRELKEVLLTFRERISGEYSTLSRNNLEATQRDPSLSDQGTDTFDREMELNMMGSEQEVIFEIDAALRRIEKGTFGICELTSQPIGIDRLKALPYVRYTVQAQSELEKGRAHYRPFGGTLRG